MFVSILIIENRKGIVFFYFYLYANSKYHVSKTGSAILLGSAAIKYRGQQYKNNEFRNQIILDSWGNSNETNSTAI